MTRAPKATSKPKATPRPKAASWRKPASKPKVAVYWGASCGGCEISLVDLGGAFLDLLEAADLVFCPALLDVKKSDVEAMADASIDLTLWNGGVRTAENEEMAHLLRRVSKTMVAYGACAFEGGVPALANLTTSSSLLLAVYDGPAGIASCLDVSSSADTPPLVPGLLARVFRLCDVVDVDASIPGCPPEGHRIAEALGVLLSPTGFPKGAVLGAGHRTVCDECLRTKVEKKVPAIRRWHEVVVDEQICLLEQGVACLGIATRDGCGALCPQVNVPCAGCYGTPDGVSDQAGKMISALGSVVEAPLPESIPDPAGTFARFSLAASVLGGKASS